MKVELDRKGNYDTMSVQYCVSSNDKLLVGGSLSSFVVVQHSFALDSRATKLIGDSNTLIFQKPAINS